MPTLLPPKRPKPPGKLDSTGIVKLLIVVLTILMFNVTETAAEDRLTFETDRLSIVIDPAHGGRENGAVGPGGQTEKAVVLALAKAVAGFLDEKYDVILTRTGDYQLPLYDRTAVANEHHAAVFLSLHTAAGRDLSSNGMYCWFNEPEQEHGRRAPTAPKSSSGDAIKWNRIQDRHWQASRTLANMLGKELKKTMNPSAVHVMGARLPVLQGADMAAVLLEAGSITHPADEAALADPGHINKLAQTIARTIDTFVQKERPASSRRLQ